MEKNQLLDGFEMLEQFNQVKHHRGVIAIATVGTDGACDFRIGANKIQDAIDSGVDEVRIASNATYAENISIDDKSITLKGGYVDCSAAIIDNQTQDKVEIRGIDNADKAVIRITGSSQRNTVFLQNLSLVNGSGVGTSGGGGISSNFANALVLVDSLHILGNNSDYGSGINIFFGNSDFLIKDTILLDNYTVFKGGGINCNGFAASIVMYGESAINSNSAGENMIPGFGGGIAIEQECAFTNYSGSRLDHPSFRFGINANYATTEGSYGGGIYATSGASIILYGNELCFEQLCFGDNINPVSVSKNRSKALGGGVYINGADTTLTIYAGLINDNKVLASGNGGGIAVVSSAQFTMARLEGTCWNNEKCNLFYGNETSQLNGFGGGVYTNFGIVDLSNVYFEKNNARSASAIYATNDNTHTRIESAIFTDNGNKPDWENFTLIGNDFGASMKIYYTTIADNNLQDGVISSNTIPKQLVSDLTIHSSIIHESNLVPVFSNFSSITNFNCIIAHDISSMQNGSYINQDNPQFVNRSNNDFHLDAFNSPLSARLRSTIRIVGGLALPARAGNDKCV